MTEPNIVLKLATLLALVVAFPTGVIAWFRILRAKTTAEYLKNIALFVLPILTVFLLADAAGMVDFPASEPTAFVAVPPAADALPKLSTLQIILLAAAGTIRIVGGNVLMAHHRRRTGKRWWSPLNPLRPPFGDFNRKEWGILGGLACISMLLAIAALNV